MCACNILAQGPNCLHANQKPTHPQPKRKTYEVLHTESLRLFGGKEIGSTRAPNVGALSRNKAPLVGENSVIRNWYTETRRSDLNVRAHALIGKIAI